MNQEKTVPGGLLVVFESIDGGGKTTNIEFVKRALAAEGYDVRTTRGHGGTKIGEALRKVSLSDIPRPPLTDVYISLAMHAALEQEIAGNREAGAITLMDRGPLSLAAYQIFGDGVDKSKMREVEDDFIRFKPELIVLYTGDVDLLLGRAKERDKDKKKADHFEKQGKDYYTRVSYGFNETAKRFNVVRQIDAEKPLEIVNAKTLALVHEAIKAKTGGA